MKPNLEISRREMLGRTLAVGSLAPHLTSALSKPAGGWRIGCYTRPWGQHEYRVALDAIAEAGFKYAGLMTTKSPNNLVISVDHRGGGAEGRRGMQETQTVGPFALWRRHPGAEYRWKPASRGCGG